MDRTPVDRTLEAHAALNVVEERIRELWVYRTWFRRYRWADHPLHRQELADELRALVRLQRQARRLARHAQARNETTAIIRRDPELAKGDHFVGMPT